MSVESRDYYRRIIEEQRASRARRECERPQPRPIPPEAMEEARAIMRQCVPPDWETAARFAGTIPVFEALLYLMQTPGVMAPRPTLRPIAGGLHPLALRSPDAKRHRLRVLPGGAR